MVLISARHLFEYMWVVKRINNTMQWKVFAIETSDAMCTLYSQWKFRLTFT